jgi:hypothetical protein
MRSAWRWCRIFFEQLAYRKRVAKAHRRHLFTIVKVKKNIVVIEVQPI